MNLRDRRPSIESAWRGYRDLVLSPAMTKDQIKESRLAFWAGASTLFYSIMGSLDDGAEPTAADLARMDSISAEIERFCATFDAEVMSRFGGRQ